MTLADPLDPEGSLRAHLYELQRAIEEDRAKTAEACRRIADEHLEPAREKQAIADAWIDFELRNRARQIERDHIVALLVRAMPLPPIFVERFSQKT